jgi:hypothetical protein
MTRAEQRAAVRDEIVRLNGRVAPEAFDDTTALVDSGILTSLMVTDLLLFLEQLRGRPVEPAQLRPGAFASVQAIVEAFLEGAR